jgi:hypothetical protein
MVINIKEKFIINLLTRQVSSISAINMKTKNHLQTISLIGTGKREYLMDIVEQLCLSTGHLRQHIANVNVQKA